MIPAGLYLIFRSTRRVILIGLMICILLIGPFILPKAVIDRIKYTVSQTERAGQIKLGDIRLDTSLSARLSSWKKAALGMIQRPVFGYGVTGFGFLDAQYLRLLVETGFVRFVVFMYLVISIFKLAIQTSRQVLTPYYKGLVAGFMAGYIGLLFHAIGANTFIIVRIMEPFWLVAAIVFAFPAEDSRQYYAGSQQPPMLQTDRA